MKKVTNTKNRQNNSVFYVHISFFNVHLTQPPNPPSPWYLKEHSVWVEKTLVQDRAYEQEKLRWKGKCRLELFGPFHSTSVYSIDPIG